VGWAVEDEDEEHLRSSFVDSSNIGPRFRQFVTGRGSVSLASCNAEVNSRFSMKPEVSMQYRPSSSLSSEMLSSEMSGGAW
jgi:hypothetical protein